jgi:hypothetical protein
MKHFARQESNEDDLYKLFTYISWVLKKSPPSRTTCAFSSLEKKPGSKIRVCDQRKMAKRRVL